MEAGGGGAVAGAGQVASPPSSSLDAPAAGNGTESLAGSGSAPGSYAGSGSAADSNDPNGLANADPAGLGDKKAAEETEEVPHVHVTVTQPGPIVYETLAIATATGEMSLIVVQTEVAQVDGN